MNLLNWFSKSSLSEKQIAKSVKLITNPYAQPDVRKDEMKRLIKDKQTVSLGGALKRFTANAQGHIADEEEKKWLEDKMVEIGEPAIEALQQYIRENDRLTYALRAYTRICGAPKTLPFLVDVLNHYGPENYRAADAKLQLILHLREVLPAQDLLPHLTAFLHDHDDNVRWSVLDLVEKTASTDPVDAVLAEKLAELACSPDEPSVRIMRRAAEMLCHLEWPLPTTQSSVNSALQGEFFLDKKKIIRRRAS
jgi:hypothetical protein